MESLSAQSKKRVVISQSLTSASIFVWGLFFLLFPLLFLTQLTDVFVLPKELLLGLVTVVTLVFWAIRLFLTEKMSFRRTSFDVPVFLFGLAVLLSAIFAVDKFDALIAVAPILFAVIAFFVLTNVVRKENSVIFLTGALVVSAIVVAVWTAFAYFKVYPLGLTFTHATNFTPLGSSLEQAIYLLAVGAFTLYFAFPLFRGKSDARTVSFAVATVLIAAGFVITVMQMIQTPPVLLPLETGFQTAFAAISQDTGRVAQGFFFGSGYGTYATVFTRFKQPSFNAHQAIWTVPFANSSSYVLELLATSGLVGIVSLFFLFFRIAVNPSKKMNNPFFISLIVLALASFLIPFSFIEVALFFLIAALYVSTDALAHPHKYFDTEVRLVAFKKGLLSFTQSNATYESSRVMAIASGVVLVIIAGIFTYFGSIYTVANVYFQNSLVAAAQNNGTTTYRDEVQAISIFPYASDYYRIFSQTNIALANALGQNLAKNGKPTQDQQNTLYTLIQQAITTGKTATQIAPLSATNWQNLSSIYRSLIGFGQNADSFAILSAQQAVTLDPSNPQEYVALGGIYYQLGQYDNAIRQFQLAVNLNPSYANAYYNLGHAYEQKQDYQNALSAYQAVKSLVTTTTDQSQINNDIANVQNKLKNNQQSAQNTQTQAANSQLQVDNQAKTALPTQPTEVPLQGPTGKPTQTVTPTPKQ